MNEAGFWTRRRWLAQVAALGAGVAAMAPARATAVPVRFAAAWQSLAAPGSSGAAVSPGGYHVGVLRQQGARLAVQSALRVPTRAHALWAEAGGTLLAAARRPGDWLVRLRASDGQALAWSWMEGGRAFNGHVIASADGRRLYTTEIDLENAAGLVGVRDAASLEKIDEWPTHGMDPHELLLDADGTLMVANGGIPTLPETGRLKVDLARMDASLVRLDGQDGSLRGQWRVADRRLSLRHMAWGRTAQGARVLGLALQAEHDEAAARATAPLFARFDGHRLQLAEARHALAGYAGDIAFAAGRFALGCPRAHGVALWQADGRWAGFVPLPEACAMAPDTQADRLWAGGAGAARAVLRPGDADAGDAMTLAVDGLRLDNHWAVLG